MTSTEEFVAIFDDLVGSANKIDVVFLEELLDNGLTESVTHTTVILAPARLAFLWI